VNEDGRRDEHDPLARQPYEDLKMEKPSISTSIATPSDIRNHRNDRQNGKRKFGMSAFDRNPAHNYIAVPGIPEGQSSYLRDDPFC
jgi:hypothetical protein